LANGLTVGCRGFVRRGFSNLKFQEGENAPQILQHLLFKKRLVFRENAWTSIIYLFFYIFWNFLKNHTECSKKLGNSLTTILLKLLNVKSLFLANGFFESQIPMRWNYPWNITKLYYNIVPLLPKVTNLLFITSEKNAEKNAFTLHKVVVSDYSVLKYSINSQKS